MTAPPPGVSVVEFPARPVPLAPPAPEPAPATPSARSGPTGRILLLFLLAFAVQAAAVLVAHAAGVREPFFKDAAGFHEVGRQLAERSAGLPLPADAREVAFTQLWGPFWLVGAVYWAAGTSWLWAKLAFALGAAAGPVGAHVLTRRIGAGNRAAWAAFTIVALWPATLFWSATGIKDGFVSGVTLGLLALVASSRSLRTVVVVVLGASGLFFFRPVAAVAVLAALAGTLALQTRRDGEGQRLAGRLALLGVMVVVASVAMAPAADELATDVDTLELRFDAESESAPILEGGLLAKIVTAARPGTLVHGALTPAPWLWDAASASPLRWLYGSTAVWILALPVTVAGATQALRARERVGLLVTITLMSYLAIYQVLFVGDFARQRTVVEPLAMVLAISFCSRRPETGVRLVAAWAGLLAVIALGHNVVVALN